MLSNVQSVWFNASNAIAQALENLDAEVNAPREEEEDDSQRRLGVEHLQDDLETYKKLLDDAQMQHFELSKQSRLLLAEKDVEIQNLKQRFGVVDEPQPASSPKKSLSAELSSLSIDSPESNLLFQQILSEKLVLESALQEAEGKLRDSLRGSNDLKVVRKNYDELNQRFEIVRNDYTQLKTEFETKEKQKNDTIDDLVQEYSRLAADAELQQQKQADRIAEVMRENEVLVTKMHALEHSISELADRSSSPVKGSSHGGEVDQASQQELKEAKAKVLNLQFDLKERHDEIDKLKATIQSLTEAAAIVAVTNAAATAAAGVASSNIVEVVTTVDPAVAAELEQVKAVLAQKEKELEQLVAAKTEQDQLATQYSAELAKLKEEHVATEEKLKAAQLAISSAGSDSAALVQTLQQELETSRKSMQELEASYQKLEDEMKGTLASKDEEIEALKQRAMQSEQAALSEATSKGSFEAQLAELASKESQLQEEIKQYQQELEVLKASSTATTSGLQGEVDAHKQKAEQLEQQLQQSQAEHDQQIAAMSANDESSRQQIIQGYVNKIESLENLVKEKESQIEALKVAFEQEKKTLEEELKAKHADELFTEVAAEKEHAQSLIQEKQKEHDEVVSKLNEQITSLTNKVEATEQQIVALKEEHLRQLEDSLAKLKTELGESHNATLQLELEKAGDAASKSLEEALQQQAQQLDLKAQDEKLALTSQLTAEKETALQTLSSEKEADKVNALDVLTTQKQEELEKALADLEAKKMEEQSAALAALTTQKDAEKQEQLEAAEQASKEKEESLRAQHEQEVAALQADVATVKRELDEVEDKYKVITKEAVDDMERKKNEEIQAALAALRAEMQGMVDQAFAERDEHLANYTRERLMRKKIHNKLLEIQGNIRVICRVRPVLEVERRSGEDVDVTEIPNDEELIIQRDPQTRSKYEYDRVFGQTSNQEEVFDAVQPLCISVLDGFNVCIFAYGQTGSGKTFTMEGYGENIGVSPRAIAELFKQVDSLKEHWTYTMQMSVLEIYNETIRDLLDDCQKNSGDKLEIRQTPEGNQVPGLTEIMITAPEQVRDLMKRGQKNRAVGSHDMNEHSSRSHSILTVTCRGKNSIDGSTTYGKLHLIDLAGSERISKTDATGDRLKEAQSINKSLSALGDVINALGNKKATHVPYRNSKLTFLLQDSLGGNSKVLTFVNISPAVYNLAETVCSLNFASRCRSTELGQAKKQTSSGGSMPSTPGGGPEGESVARQLLREKKMMSSSFSGKESVSASAKK